MSMGKAKQKKRKKKRSRMSWFRLGSKWKDAEQDGRPWEWKSSWAYYGRRFFLPKRWYELISAINHVFLSINHRDGVISLG